MVETRWARANCVDTEVDGSLVLLNLDSLAYHSLNGTAAATWRLLETPKTESELTQALCASYAVEPVRCAASVQRLMQSWSEQKLVTALDV